MLFEAAIVFETKKKRSRNFVVGILKESFLQNE